MARRFPRTLGILLIVIVLLALILGALGVVVVRQSFPQTDGSLTLPGLEHPVEVLRDGMGVPHIYAQTTHDLFMAQGYVHAQDRFWQMEFWRRLGSGRLSEILGEGGLSTDKFVRTVGWHRTAAKEVDMMTSDERAVLQAYADGVNAYLAANKGRLSVEFTLLGLNGVRYDPEPWTPYNTLTWAKVMAWDLGANMSDELLRAQIATRLGKAAIPVLEPLYPADFPVIVTSPATLESVPEAAFTFHPMGSGFDLGSNNWVVSGSRTDTGKPYLADDPHLGIQMPSIWYENGLHCNPVGPACPFDVVGASFASAPGVIIGHNDRIAWGVTNLPADVQDLFVEKVNPDDPNQYQYQGQWLDMTIIPETIRVAGKDEPVIVYARETRHGPIINDVVGGEEEKWNFGWQPMALSWTALQPSTLFRAVLKLNLASNWDEFREALSLWDVPSQNFVYADVDGNIGYQSPGRIPIRASGDGSLPVEGWTGEHEWVNTIPFDNLPRSFNPPAGFIVTANNRVIGDTYPYLLTNDWDPGYRAKRIVAALDADTSVTLADMQALQADSTPEWAKEFLPYVTDLTSQDARVSQALDLLRAWDGRAVRDSAGAALFESYVLHLVDLTFHDELGDDLMAREGSTARFALIHLIGDPTSPWFDDKDTPAVEGRDEIELKALQAAVEELTASLGENMSKWRWGDLHTATFQNQSLGKSGFAPAEWLLNRGPYEVDGTIATVNNTGYDVDKPYAETTVPSYRQIIDLADLSRSVSIHTTGQSGHAFHRHYADMIDLWRNLQYHPMLWTRQQADAAAEGRLTLNP